MNHILKKQKIPFTQIPNTLLNDPDLSFKAKGIYAYMASKPDYWNFTIRSMAKSLKDGRDSIMGGIQELKAFGWIKYSKLDDGSGKYIINAKKNIEATSGKPATPNPENQPPQIRNIPHTENPSYGKAGRISNSIPSSNKDITTNSADSSFEIKSYDALSEISRISNKSNQIDLSAEYSRAQVDQMIINGELNVH